MALLKSLAGAGAGAPETPATAERANLLDQTVSLSRDDHRDAVVDSAPRVAQTLGSPLEHCGTGDIGASIAAFETVARTEQSSGQA